MMWTRLRWQPLALFAAISILPWNPLTTARVAAGQDAPLRPSARRNVGRVLDKLRAGKAVTVAYLGGSITAGSGASDPSKTSYRALVTDWLRARYPRAKVTEINASVANTGSLYASMRTRRDVIAHKPDLVFIEFAAFDAMEREDVARRAVEGVVRQLLTVSQPPEIVFLYSANPARSVRVEWHDAVAGYYRLPSIDLQAQTGLLIDGGKLATGSMWSGANLSDEGHRTYARLVTEFLLDQERQPATEIVKSIPPPFLSDELTYGELIPTAQLKHDLAWRNEAQGERALPSNLLVGDRPGSQFETVFEGTVAGLTFRAGPDGGTVECSIDGRPAPAPLDRIDTYNATPQIAARIIAGGLGPGEHRLTVRIIGDKNPKSTGSLVRLGYLLVGGQRPERL